MNNKLIKMIKYGNLKYIFSMLLERQIHNKKKYNNNNEKKGTITYFE